MKPQTDKKSQKPQKFSKKPVKPAVEIKPAFTKLTSQFDSANIPKDAVQILNNFDEVIQGVRPLNSKQQQQLPAAGKRQQRRAAYAHKEEKSEK